MEKERYMLIYNEDELGYSIIDTEEQFSDDMHSWDLLCDLLNQQDARIKELEEQLSTATMWHGCDILVNELKQENQQLKQKIKQLKFDCAMYKSANYLINEYGIEKAREIMFQSEKKLKQSQNQKAIEVLEQLVKYFAFKDDENDFYEIIADYGDILDWIDDQIKELRSEENDQTRTN